MNKREFITLLGGAGAESQFNCRQPLHGEQLTRGATLVN